MGQPGAAFQRMALPVRASRAGTIVSVLLAAALFNPFQLFADEAEELRASIVVHCFYSVGEFGSQLVDICVEENLAAAAELEPGAADGLAVHLQTAHAQLEDAVSAYNTALSEVVSFVETVATG